MTSPQRKLIQDRYFIWALLVGTPASSALFFLTKLSGINQAALSWQQLFWLVLLSPVLEELIFRGGIQRCLLHWPLLRKQMFQFTHANWVTSILFCLTHLYSQPPLWAAAMMAPSLLFGWFRDRYHSVIPGIALHVFFNLGFFLPAYIFTTGKIIPLT